ncbi:MAG: regulatory iron-sulfur-containing complex subunit RicT [Eubacteriales bacterium]|nr:regulatory iron-sulfur-containing complex subunit RicT [Eubacteriales bacterium]
MKVIGVRFKSSGRIYYFDPLEFIFQEGDGVIVETARGQEYGEVAQVAMEVEDSVIVSPLKPVVRPATEQDTTMREQNCAKEGDAFKVCQQKIEQHKLDMHLVSAEYSFNGSKLVFYFTADERVDFRELVKDLAAQFRTRIELRQIGVRDEAKMLGGLGSCGRAVCCKTFLDDFHPVSIKMAKEQNLSLSPTKISGLCGRLMCCLQYEQSCYEEMRRKMPHVNREILTPNGVGIVVENNVITEKTKVRLTMPDGTIDVREYHYETLAKPGEPLPVPQPPQPEANAPAVPNEAVTETGTEATPGAQERSPDKKRRRRGGRGKSGNRSNTGAAPAEGSPTQQNTGANMKPRQDGQQQNRPSRPQAPANGGKPPQTQRVGGASGPARPNNPPRRDNMNRPRPSKPAPEKQES